MKAPEEMFLAVSYSKSSPKMSVNVTFIKFFTFKHPLNVITNPQVYIKIFVSNNNTQIRYLNNFKL